MSHFMVTVLVPKDTRDIKQEVRELLAPYNEQLETEPLAEYNPRAKWDWYEIGGRWGEVIKHNICPVSELPKDFNPFAIVTPDGEWHERGKMGLWAMVSNEKDDAGWGIEQACLLEVYKDCIAVIVGCHI